jgi:hypothetical protein
MDETTVQPPTCDPAFAAELDAIASAVKANAPFDVSPRGITFRPGEPLAAKLDGVVARRDAAVPALAARLESEHDALLSLVWSSLLVRIGTPAAHAAIDAFVESVVRDERWKGQFPGRREVLLFLGRSDPGQGASSP